MRVLFLLITSGVSCLFYSQEPFFVLEYSIIDCETCTVSSPIGPFTPIAIGVDQRGEEKVEFEYSYLKTDSIYKTFTEQPPSEIEIKITNQKTKESMRIKVKTESCLNGSVSLIRVPFQAGYFEPKLKDGCYAELDPEYEWSPLNE